MRVESAALFAILEQYQRRSEACTSRLIGAILGTVSLADGDSNYVADIKHCFPIPHSEVGSQVSINGEYYRSRMSLHRKCYGRESVLLGWYSIRQQGPAAAEDADVHGSTFIREFFARETGSAGAPVAFHLALALSPADSAISHEAFKCPSLSVHSAGSSEASKVAPRPVPCQLTYGVPELGAINTVKDAWLQAIETEGPQASLVRLPPHSESIRRAHADFDSQVTQLREALRGCEDAELKEETEEVLSALGIPLEAGAQFPSLDAQLLAKSRSQLADLLVSLRRNIEGIDDVLLSSPPPPSVLHHGQQ